MVSVPLDPIKEDARYEYRCQVWDGAGKVPVVFHTNWQVTGYAIRTYEALRKAMPTAKITRQRRSIHVQEYTP